MLEDQCRMVRKPGHAHGDNDQNLSCFVLCSLPSDPAAQVPEFLKIPEGQRMKLRAVNPDQVNELVARKLEDHFIGETFGQAAVSVDQIFSLLVEFIVLSHFYRNVTIFF